MYKSQLQELCHRRLWNLPDYQMTKEGPVHNPRYSANIIINGVEFQTPSPCRTSKEAQNNVAKLACEHFSHPKSEPSSSPLASNSSSVPQSSLPQPSFPQPSFPPTPFSLPQPSAPTSTASSSPAIGVVETLYKKNVTKPEVPNASQPIEMKMPIASEKDNITTGNQKNDSMSSVIDMQRLYKNQLQNYSQKRNLNLPEYSTEREGPPHASRFKCKVTIDGQTFESPQFFPTLKDAEHAAAKVALMSLQVAGAQEDDIGLYKNLLQELIQKEGLRLPVYSTTKSGEAHMPTFVSNVEIEGVLYTGQEAKTKKQAEMSAAKVAYTNLKERKGKLNQSSLIQPPPHRTKAPALSSCSSESTVPTHQHHANSKSPISYNPNSVTQNQYQDKDCAAEVKSYHTAHPFSEHVTVTSGRDSASSEITTGRVETAYISNVQSSPSLSKSDNLARGSDGKPSSAANTSTCKKVTVYSRKTNVEIASGGTVLSISDENWVAYSYPE
ncbi:double-stranded RNA-binding protein 1-like isoform X2 [Prosopis cineraria]|uniref:double-stranded RNA-binding protein 1-like isoform X2 n=1 Tax=Prosopis cineraria TaxID=364024 RepID=UPI00240EF17A|nr:double-stranded RNA-binding protein 1-like isoform X2 [Prosopis cineraria]